MSNANAKAIKRPWGSFTKARRRWIEKHGREITVPSFNEAWYAERPDVVDVVVEVLEEWAERKAQTEARLLAASNALRPSKRAEKETIEYHDAQRDEMFGPDFETFTK